MSGKYDITLGQVEIIRDALAHDDDRPAWVRNLTVLGWPRDRAEVLVARAGETLDAERNPYCVITPEQIGIVRELMGGGGAPRTRNLVIPERPAAAPVLYGLIEWNGSMTPTLITGASEHGLRLAAYNRIKDGNDLPIELAPDLEAATLEAWFLELREATEADIVFTVLDPAAIVRAHGQTPTPDAVTKT